MNFHGIETRTWLTVTIFNINVTIDALRGDDHYQQPVHPRRSLPISSRLSYQCGEMKLRLETTVSLLCLICASDAGFSDSGVPCYLHPSSDKCHYRAKPDSPTCTSAEQRQRLTEGIRQLNRTFTVLETKLISLGISTLSNYDYLCNVCSAFWYPGSVVGSPHPPTWTSSCYLSFLNPGLHLTIVLRVIIIEQYVSGLDWCVLWNGI